jgi:hypothetical protein
MTVNEKTSWDNDWEAKAWHDPLDTVIWAAAFIWAGAVWLASSFGYIEEQAWSLFFLGAGALVLVELAIRLLVPAHRRDLLGTLIWAGAMFCLGGWGYLWSLVLVGIGVALLLRGLSPQQKTILVKEEGK